MLKEETQKEINARNKAYNHYQQVGHRFYDGLLNVKNSSGWGCINDDGELIIPCAFVEQVIFDGDYARASLGRHRYGLIDKKGVEWIPFEYDNVSGYDEEGFARFEKGIYWGTIDMEGKIHIKPKMKFQHIGPFLDGIAVAKTGTKFGLIDTEGNHLTEFKYYEIDPFVDHLYRVRIKPRIYNFMRRDGSLLFPENVSFISEFDDNDIAVFSVEPTPKKKKQNPEMKDKYGIAHLSGIIIFPAIYYCIEQLEESELRHLYIAMIGRKSYYLCSGGDVFDAYKMHKDFEEIEKKNFFKKLMERYPITSNLKEEVLNWVLSGLQLFYRDSDEDICAEDIYKEGDIFRAGDYLEVTPELHKPSGHTRFIIASAHAAPWFEHQADRDPDMHLCKLHIIHRNSYLRVMDIYKKDGVTQVFLLHIPYRGIPMFISDTYMHLIQAENGMSLTDMARRSLDEKSRMPLHPTSLNKEWLIRTNDFPGICKDLCFHSIEYDTRKYHQSQFDKAIHRAAHDNAPINLPDFDAECSENTSS